jgi:hypothetical protein
MEEGSWNCVSSLLLGPSFKWGGGAPYPSPKAPRVAAKEEEGSGQGWPAKETLTRAGLGQGLGRPLFSFLLFP